MASLPEVPGPVRRGAKEDALRATADLLYGGDVSRLDGDLCYYADGFALLARDLQRDAPLLFAPGPLTDKQRAARERLATDLRALLPFSLVHFRDGTHTFRWIGGMNFTQEAGLFWNGQMGLRAEV